ncbi:MAG: threonine synthase [Candidatus Eiseniibacteriota bacterium]|nr:MAG: threonine synthase [Candidatus Eisenbacteria bacterium]
MDYHLKCTLCGEEYDRDAVRYVCPKHGDEGILDTIPDYAKLAEKLSPLKISNSRDFSIWRYAALLPLEDPRRSAPSLQVGWTPLYRSVRLGTGLGLSNLYFKDDGRNPSASFKDRASAVLVAKARELGVRIITTASTGNAGAALAALAAAAKLPAVIFVPQTAPQAKIAQLLVFGGRVILVKGTYDEAFDLCLEASRSFGWYCRNTAYNPYTVEGKKTASFEICEQLTQLTAAAGKARPGGWRVPDRIFVPVGDGNIVSGLWKGLRDLLALGWIEKMPKLMGVQAEGSAACYNAWRAGRENIERVNATTLADSISADLPRDGVRAVRAVRETGGAYLIVTDEEILAAIPELGRGEAIFSEPAAAAAYAGLKTAVRDGLVKSDETVVCMVTGNGLKDIASAMKAAGEGTVIEPTLEAVKRLNLE